MEGPASDVRSEEIRVTSLKPLKALEHNPPYPHTSNGLKPYKGTRHPPHTDEAEDGGRRQRGEDKQQVEDEEVPRLGGAGVGTRAQQPVIVQWLMWQWWM